MKTESLVLLSGEESTLPEAEARALFLTYDPGATFRSPEKRLLIAKSAAEPWRVSARVAYSRRVGLLVSDGSQLRELVRGRRVRFRSFGLGGARKAEPDPASYLDGTGSAVDLTAPDFEVTLVRGSEDYLAVTKPTEMMQGWSKRRPRRRAFFHPSAIFPKLSRALVNLCGCREGETILDPFAGTGSLLIEARCVGLSPVGVDLAPRMAVGALANMKGLGQDWLGVVRADAFSLPVRLADAVATDVPYGRASSTGGRAVADVLGSAADAIPGVLRSGRRAVVMHPMSAPLESTPRLEVLENHYLYMHRNLTRVATVLRRR